MKKDLKEKKSGKLLFLEDTGKRKHGGVLWKCRCDCGNYHEVEARFFNVIKSCGCSKYTSFGHSKERTPTYYSWEAMKTRCLNEKSKDYSRYGGRGIMVCERWMVFENFLADMGIRPEGKTLDRIDGNGHYEPDNCKWSTYLEQRYNRI